MSIFDGIIYGLIQGLTEFLPVSSSGHLILFEKILGDEPNLLFNVLLHVGTLFAVFICYRKQLLEIIRHPFSKKTLKLVVATIPTCALAVLFKFLLPDALEGAFLPLGFMVTAVVLFATVIIKPKQKEITFPKAAFCGFMQGIAVLPAISRSGMTISSLLLTGADKDEATEFSFLLSVPIIIASAVWEGIELRYSSVVFEAAPTLIGMAVAFVSGLLAIKFMIKLIKNKSLLPFSIYTFLLSVTLLVLEIKGVW